MHAGDHDGLGGGKRGGKGGLQKRIWIEEPAEALVATRSDSESFYVNDISVNS